MPSSRRQRQLARMRARQQQRVLEKRAKAAVRRRRWVIAGSVVGVLAVVLGSTLAILLTGGSGTRAAAPTAGPSAGACTWTPNTSESTGGRHPGLPPTTPEPGPATATLQTSVGAITVRLDTTNAPCASTSFLHLARSGFYSGTKCHRLVTSGIFVLQCGDPTGTGTGGPGYSFADENLTPTPTYPAGTLAMANGGPDTNGSQFFVVYRSGSGLGPNYTPFGTVTAGLDAVVKVAKAGVATKGSTDGPPKLAVTITKVTTVPATAPAPTSPAATGPAPTTPATSPTR